MAKQLVIGTGKLGKRFYHYLESLGLSVITLSKSAKPWSKNHIQCDLLAKDFVLPTLPEVENLYIILAPSERTEAAYKATYIDAVANLLKQLKVQQPKLHCTFLSATSVYGSRQLGLIDEASSPLPDNFRGELLLEAEKQVKKLAPSSSIVRASGLYSRQRPRLTESLTNSENISNPKWLNLIHEDDLCHWLYQASYNQWPLSIASDGAPFTRAHLHEEKSKIQDEHYRQFKSQYLDFIQLKNSSFTEWLKDQ
ncbi:MAG: sugar nucleotide-binding protein [Gammaproteobacteria bacterium]|nr:sugar nucleotide-binding protein [Gammaproteobacteria bacterium]